MGTLPGDLSTTRRKPWPPISPNRTATPASPPTPPTPPAAGRLRPPGLQPLVLRFANSLLRQAFRDGLPGFIHIAIGCFNSFAKYAKLLEQCSGAPPR